LIRTSLTSVSSISSFSLIDTFSVNPGLRGTFPWLSTIAANYDQYCLNSLSLEYVNAAPATRQGFIYMVPDYDVYDGAPSTPQGAMNQMGSKSMPVWTSGSISLVMGAAMSVGPRRFIRQAASSRDQSLTDVAKIHVFYSDLTSTDALPGQLWINYDVTLFAPQMIPSTLVNRSSINFDSTAKSVFVSAGFPVEPFLPWACGCYHECIEEFHCRPNL